MTKAILSYLATLWAALLASAFFIFIVLPPTFLAFPLPPRYRLMMISPFWLSFSQFMLRVGCWCRIYSEDRRQPELRTYPPRGLYIANHQSYVDIPLMLSKYQVLPIMKKEVLYIPIFGIAAWAAGALVVSRDKANSRKKVFHAAKKRLADDKFSLMYYPEGTRSRAGAPRTFEAIKTTLIHVAFENNVPLIPISMYGTSRVLTKKGLVNPGKKVGIITHEALWPKDYSNSEAFAHAAWEKVLQGHTELTRKLETPRS